MPFKEKHGYCGTRTYRIWLGMKQRCFVAKTKDFHRYGGRGVVMCDSWRHSFEAFLRDMGPCPDGKMIDRFPNNDGNYEPSNCRWATMLEQAQNTRTTKLVTFNGQTHSLSEWARRVGLGQTCLSRRLICGWSIERALTRPSKPGPDRRPREVVRSRPLDKAEAE